MAKYLLNDRFVENITAKGTPRFPPDAYGRIEIGDTRVEVPLPTHQQARAEILVLCLPCAREGERAIPGRSTTAADYGHTPGPDPARGTRHCYCLP